MDIILIAGLWLDGTAWDDMLPGLRAAGHHPIPLTLPGQGDGATAATLDEQLGTVVAALDGCANPALVVGHSGHCTLAWLAADRRPAKVAAVAMIGGMPTAEGDAYFGMLPATGGQVNFPGWEPFEGPDADDLTPEMRASFERHMHGMPEGVTSAQVHYSNDQRHQIPVVMVCPEYSPDDVRAWLAAGELPELEQAQLSYVDLETGHWPMFSAPRVLADAIVDIASSLST